MNEQKMTTGLIPSPAGWQAWVSTMEDDGTVSHSSSPLVGHLELTDPDTGERSYRPCWHHPAGPFLTDSAHASGIVTVTGPGEGLATQRAEMRARDRRDEWARLAVAVATERASVRDRYAAALR